MTNTEKLELIRKLVLNLAPLDFEDPKIGLGAAFGLCVATELIIDSKDGTADGKE